MYKKSKEQKRKEELELKEKINEIKKYVEQGFADKPIKIVEKRAIDIANDFKKTAEIIHEYNSKQTKIWHNILNPFVVNSIFSVELYLKIILKKINTDRTGHELFKLFAEMEQSEIGKQVVFELSEEYKKKTNLELQDFMKKYNDAFENFRYSYEIFNGDGSVDYSKELLEFNDDEILTALDILSNYCNKNCEDVIFGE